MSNIDDLVSIIVPVYNVEKYLKKCLDSIINQTYKNIEILLVDDGSTDNSGIICDEYAKKDPRITVIHKENAGLSEARNTGLDYARGKYISFIDSDDYIEEGMIFYLYHDCKDNNCQIANSNKIWELENGKKIYLCEIENSEIVDTETALKNLLLNDPSVANKLFERCLFDDIRFIKDKLYEDILTTPLLIEKSERIFLDKRHFYHYIQHENSIVHKSFSKKKMDYMYNAKELFQHIKIHYPNISEVAEAYYILVLITIISEAYYKRNEMNSEYKEIYEELKLFKNKYRNNKFIPISKKVMIFLCLKKQIPLVNFVKKIKNKLKFK